MVEKKSRILIVCAVFLIIAAVFVLRLVNLQIINGDEYLKESESGQVKKITLSAPRGEILDRHFSPIVTNSSSFVVKINIDETEDINSTVCLLIDIFERNNQEYIDSFPISSLRPYAYSDELLGNEKAVDSFNTYLKRAKVSVDNIAEDTVAALIDYYGLEDYSTEDARKIVAVRYGIYLNSENGFYTFSEDVSIEVATAVKEKSAGTNGIYLTEVPIRYYTHDYFASHIIGYTGRIYAEEVETYKALGYSMSEKVGKEGIEKSCEQYLRGTEGYVYYLADSETGRISIIEDVEPQIGNDIILTLDTELQMTVESGLDELLDKIHKQNGEESGKSAMAVYMEVETGEILAMASNPTYNLGTYGIDYAENASNPAKPFLNRCIAGTYPIGSTFKMVTGIAGLEEGVIKKNTVFNCEGRYSYFTDYQPGCFASRIHGNVDVRGALKVSCNIFFYDLGRRLGIDTVESYAKKFGFGEKTGIELLGEKAGIVAGRTYRESLGKTWEASEVLTAVIGQSDNSATPLQVCNYIATIANGGKRMQPHIIKSIRNNQTGKIVSETKPVIVENLDLSDATVEAIKEGLIMATQKGGSAHEGFIGFDEEVCQVAVKTGTAEMPTGQPSALLVGFAPADNPKIAFAVVVENGGINVTTIISESVKNALRCYFSAENQHETVDEEGRIIY